MVQQTRINLLAAVTGAVQYHVAWLQKKTLLHGVWGGNYPVRLNELRFLGVFIKAAAKGFLRFQPQRVVIHFAAPTHNAALKTQN